MAEVRITLTAPDLRSDHAVASVFNPDDVGIGVFRVERGPSTARVKFHLRSKQER